MFDERRLVLYRNQFQNNLKLSGNRMDSSSNASCFQQKQMTTIRKPEKTKTRRPDKQLYIPRAKRKNDTDLAEASNQTIAVDILATDNKIKVESQRKSLKEKKIVRISSDIKTDDLDVLRDDEQLLVLPENEVRSLENNSIVVSHQPNETCELPQCDKQLPVSEEETKDDPTESKSNGELERTSETVNIDLTQSDLKLNTNFELINPEHSIDLSSESEVNELSAVNTSLDEDTNKSSEESSWEALYNEEGECLAPDLLQDLTDTLGKVTIEKPKIDYYKYQSKVVKEHEFDHIIEIYNFPIEFKTPDLISAFAAFRDRGFDIKWVDDTHALGLFASPMAAAEALSMRHSIIKTRALSEGTRESQLKARRSGELLQPYKPRPETSATLARRLVTGALGLNSLIPREQRAKERQQLIEAKAKKKLTAKQKNDVWEGAVN